MPRKQQQAVFASMGSRSDSTISDRGMQYKREKLAREGLTVESKQDKADKIMQNKRLTHRQKMAQIAKLKAKPIGSGSHSTSVSIVRVPSGIDRGAFDSIVMKKKLPSTNLYDSGNLLLTQEEYVRGTKNRHSLPKGAKILNTPPGGSKRAFDAFMFRAKAKPNTYVRDNNLVLPMKDYKKGLRRNARVRFGTRDWKAKHKLEQDKIIKEAKKGFIEKGIRPPGVAAVYEKAIAKHDNPQGKVHWKGVRPENVKKVGSHYEANGKLIFWHGTESVDAHQALKKASFHKGRSPWQTVAGYSRSATAKDKEKHSGYPTKQEKRNKKDMSYKQLQKAGHKLSPHKDSDGDGVKNSKDCRPLDKKRQDRTTFVSEKLAKKYANLKKSQGYSIELKKEAPKKGRFGFHSIDNWVVYTKKNKKSMSYAQLKKSGAKLKPGADSDGDGVKNSKDCRPLDKNKQDINWGKTGGAIAKAGSSYIGKKMHERTPEGRIEKAKKKIKALDQKEKAEYYENVAEAKKQLYEEGRRG